MEKEVGRGKEEEGCCRWWRRWRWKWVVVER